MIKLMKYRVTNKGERITDTVATWTCLPSAGQIRKKLKHPDDFGIELLLRDRQVRFDKCWYYLERVK